MTRPTREYIPPRAEKESPVTKGWGRTRWCEVCKVTHSVTQFDGESKVCKRKQGVVK